MPLPASVTTVPVHIKIVSATDGRPGKGRVQFTAPVALRDTTDMVILGPNDGAIVAELDANGEATVSLIATDDPDISPSGWAYTVYVATDVWRPEPWQVQIPVAAVGTLELSTLAPAATPQSLVTYALDSGVAHKGDLVFSARDYGARGDGRRVRGVTASSASAVVTVPGGSFASSDVGKAAVVYTDTAAGTITTILSVQSATSITLAAAAGITVSGSTGYILYGTDDSAAFTSAFTAAAARTTVDTTVGPNQPQGGGQPTVIAPATSPASLYVLTSAVTVPSGVAIDCQGMLVNLLADRYAPALVANPYSSVRKLSLEAMFGTGIQLGTAAGTQADVHAGTLVLWHVGKTTEGSGLLRSQDAVTLLGYSFLIDLIWVKGGQTGIRHAAGSDASINRAMLIGAHTGVSMAQSNQVYYGSLILDSCGEIGGGYSGVILDNACTDIDINVQAFEVVGTNRKLDNVVLVGNGSTNKSVYLRMRVMAQKTGGTVLNLAQAQDIEATLLASNTVTPSSGGNDITTAVVWGTVAGSCRIHAEMNGTIVPYSGTPGGTYRWTRGGVEYMVQGGAAPTLAALAANGTGAPTPTVTGNDQRGKVSFGSGTGPTTGSQVTITFASSTGWVTSAPFVTLTPLNAATAALQPYVASCTATALTIGFGVAPTASQSVGSYQLHYRIEG